MVGVLGGMWQLSRLAQRRYGSDRWRNKCTGDLAAGRYGKELVVKVRCDGAAS